jgi:Cys-tRNA(Pro)/Cys-tRNA(Cys) deacylase
MKKNYPTYIHSTAPDYEFIYVSAGVRGLQIKIDPKALIDCCAMTVAALVVNG